MPQIQNRLKNTSLSPHHRTSRSKHRRRKVCGDHFEVTTSVGIFQFIWCWFLMDSSYLFCARVEVSEEKMIFGFLRWWASVWDVRPWTPWVSVQCFGHYHIDQAVQFLLLCVVFCWLHIVVRSANCSCTSDRTITTVVCRLTQAAMWRQVISCWRVPLFIRSENQIHWIHRVGDANATKAITILFISSYVPNAHVWHI